MTAMASAPGIDGVDTLGPRGAGERFLALAHERIEPRHVELCRTVHGELHECGGRVGWRVYRGFGLGSGRRLDLRRGDCRAACLSDEIAQQFLRAGRIDGL